jgi:hypothetical protein
MASLLIGDNKISFCSEFSKAFDDKNLLLNCDKEAFVQGVPALTGTE